MNMKHNTSSENFSWKSNKTLKITHKNNISDPFFIHLDN